MLIIFEKPIAKNNNETNKFEEKTKAYELVGSATTSMSRLSWLDVTSVVVS